MGSGDYKIRDRKQEASNEKGETVQGNKVKPEEYNVEESKYKSTDMKLFELLKDSDNYYYNFMNDENSRAIKQEVMKLLIALGMGEINTSLTEIHAATGKDGFKIKIVTKDGTTREFLLGDNNKFALKTFGNKNIKSDYLKGILNTKQVKLKEIKEISQNEDGTINISLFNNDNTFVFKDNKVIGITDKNGKYTYQKDLSKIINSNGINLKDIKSLNSDSSYIKIETLGENNTIILDKKDYSIKDILDSSGKSTIKTLDTFSEEAKEYGAYGGYQGYLVNNFEELKDNPTIKSIIEKYFPDENLSDEKLKLLFTKMSSVGCGFIACTNSIFEGTDNLTNDEFYQKFGYERYKTQKTKDGSNIKINNYEYVFLDYFLYYQKNVAKFSSIEAIYGNTSANSGDSALSGMFNTGAQGTYGEIIANVAQDYLDEKQIDMKYNMAYPEYNSALLPFDKNKYSNRVKEGLEEGKTVVISMKHFDIYSMEDLDGNNILDDIVEKDVGSHAMTVTGVTEDGDYIVSSWGKEYLVKPTKKGLRRIIMYDYD